MSISSIILLTATMFTDPLSPVVQDLCEVVNERGAPVYCLPHRVDAPVLQKDVCCDDDTCEMEGEFGCGQELNRYHCEYGEIDAANDVTCYFQAEDYCDVHPCDVAPPPDAPDIEAEFICCYYGICTEHHLSWNYCEIDHVYWCQSPCSMPDGTVECADGE